jgi:hypothetical protein
MKLGDEIKHEEKNVMCSFSFSFDECVWDSLCTIQPKSIMYAKNMMGSGEVERGRGW